MRTHALDLTLWLMDNYEPEYAVCNIYHKLGKIKTRRMSGDPGTLRNFW